MLSNSLAFLIVTHTKRLYLSSFITRFLVLLLFFWLLITVLVLLNDLLSSLYWVTSVRRHSNSDLLENTHTAKNQQELALRISLELSDRVHFLSDVVVGITKLGNYKCKCSYLPKPIIPTLRVELTSWYFLKGIKQSHGRDAGQSIAVV